MKKTLFIIVCILNTMWASAQFSGSGSGTASDPYLIFNATQLAQIGNFLNNANVVFELKNDIDLTDFINDNNPSEGWTPIGVSATPFKGKLIGNNRTIRGLFVNRPGIQYVGLFGIINGATISNLTVIATTVKGASDTGVLTGYAINATISDIIIYAQNVSGTTFVGAMAGRMFGTCKNVMATAKVSGSQYVGGLIGSTGGSTGSSYENCSQIGDVNAKSCVGGISGYSSTTANFTGCKSQGTIISTGDYAGGILGRGSFPSMTNCSHFGDITGKNCVGGILGLCEEGATITNNSFYGDVRGTDGVGGLVGEKSESLKKLVIEQSYAVGNVIGENKVGGLVGASLKVNSKRFLNSTYSSYVKNLTYSSASDTYKYSLNSDFSSASAKGVILEISRELSGQGIWVYNYLLGQSGKVYARLSESTYEVGDTTAFRGYIVIKSRDANSYESSSSGYKLYRVIPDSPQFHTITFDGKNQIQNSYFNGTATGLNDVGGIVGFTQTADIVRNYVNASVRGKSNVGGIIGIFDTGNSHDGKSTIKSNIAICMTISASESNVGRIYGYKADDYVTIGALGTAEGNLSLNNTSVVKSGVVQTITDDLQNGTSIGPSMLKLKATYVAKGWDFDNDWTIQETESYPYKRYQAAPPVIESQLVSHATEIQGKSVDGGTVYMYYKGYEPVSTSCVANQWSFSTEELQSGAQVRLYADVAGMAPSYFTTATVKYPGNGTETDPYQIYSAEDLRGMSNAGYYKIMNDIDLTNWINENSPTAGWQAVGTNSSAATHIDGDGHTVKGLWINTTSDYNGLFSNYSSGDIKNLTVEVANGKKVKAGDYTGILIGRMYNGQIINCNIKGDVQGTIHVGGIVGYTEKSMLKENTYAGTVTSSSANAYVGGIAGHAKTMDVSNNCAESTITASGNTSFVGGLFGYVEDGIVTECKTKTNVTVNGTDSNVGGLIGKSSASVSKCHSEGSVAASGGNSIAAGLIGTATGDVSDCYSSAKVNGTQYSAGLVGYAYGHIDRCYASGDIYGVKYGAGVACELDGTTAAVTNSVAMNNIISLTDQSSWGCRVIGGFKNGCSDPNRSNYALKSMQVSLNNIPQTKTDDNIEGTAKAADVLMSSAFYEALGWDMESIWGIDEGTGYPFLQWDNASTEPEILPGDVDGDSEISVTDVQAIITMILHKTDYQDYSAVPLTPKAADLDGDGEVSVTDAAYVIDMILRSTSMKSKRRVAAAVESDLFELGNPVALGDNMYRVDVLLKDYVDMTAAQFELHLPDGMTLCDYESGDKHHSVSHRSEDSERFVCFSNGNKAFRSNVVVTLTVRNDNSSWGLLLSNIELVRSNLTKVRSAREHLGEDAPTCIQNLDVDRSEPLYDMQGRRVQRARSGIYIQNGKKVLVK